MRLSRLAVLFVVALSACHERPRGHEDAGAPLAPSAPAPPVAPSVAPPAASLSAEPFAPILPTMRPHDASPPPSAPLPEPGEPVRLDLEGVAIRDVLPMLEAVSGEPVIVDPEAEPLVRCGHVSLVTEHEVPPEAATKAIFAALQRAGLAVIDTKKGVVLQKASGAPVPPCPAP
jgi:hypothetical protein